jgi:hypothetical protein
MRRREFIAGLSGAAAAWPLAARAQQSALPVIGFLSGYALGPGARYVAAFNKGLGEAGFIDGRNITMEFRCADYQYERLSALSHMGIARLRSRPDKFARNQLLRTRTASFTNRLSFPMVI